VIRVDDDGPGLEPGLREAVLQRGVRADQAGSGSGLAKALAGPACPRRSRRIALGITSLPCYPRQIAASARHRHACDPLASEPSR